MPPRSLSPLLRFNAKSSLADFSRPIDIPHKLDPLDFQTNIKSQDFANTNEFAKRTQIKGWSDGAQCIIKDIQQSQIKEQKENQDFFIETEEIERMEHLKVLMKDEDDFVFGKDGVLDSNEKINEITPIKMNAIFENKENIDEVEMYVMGFNDIINVLRKDTPKLSDTLKQIRNFFIYKIKEKSKKQQSLEYATKNLDARCFQLQLDSDNLTIEICRLNKDLNEYNSKLEKQIIFSEKLKQLNFKLMFEKENLANSNEAVQKQNIQLIAEISHQQQEKNDLNNRTRRLQVSVTKFRSIAEQSHDKIQRAERKVIDLENVIEEHQLSYKKLFDQYSIQQALINTQNEHIQRLQEEINNGCNKFKLVDVPETASDTIKQALQVLIEISQLSSQDLLVKELGIDRTSLHCAYNVVASLQNSDFCEQVLEHFSPTFENVTQYRTVAVQIDGTMAENITVIKKANGGKRKQLIPIEQKSIINQQATLNVNILQEEILAKQQDQTQFLLSQIEKLKRDNMNLQQKQMVANMEYLNRSQASFVENSNKNSDNANNENSQVTESDVREINEFSQGLSEGNALIDADKSTFISKDIKDKPKKQLSQRDYTNKNTRKSLLKERQGSVYKKQSTNNSSIVYGESTSEETYNNNKKHKSSTEALPNKTQLLGYKKLLSAEKLSGLKYGQVYVTNLEMKTKETLDSVVDYQKDDLANLGKQSDNLSKAQSLIGKLKIVSQSNKINIHSQDDESIQSSNKDSTYTQSHISSRNIISQIQDTQQNTDKPSLVLPKPSNVDSLITNRNEQQQKDTIQMLSVQQSNILQQINNIVKTLPADVRSQYKTQLNNVLFKHIDNTINKRNFNIFYQDYIKEWNQIQQIDQGNQKLKAPKELLQILLDFLTQADTVKTVNKNPQEEKKELQLEKIQFEIPENVSLSGNTELNLLNPLEEVTSLQIQQQNIFIIRANEILQAFGVDFVKLTKLSNDQFIKHTQALVKKLKATKQETLFKPNIQAIEQRQKKQQNINDIAINQNALDDELFPLQSEAIILKNQINDLDNYMNEEQLLGDKVKNFVPPKQTQEIQTIESAIGIDYCMQTDIALEDFINDTAIAKDIKEMFAGDVNSFKVTGLVGMDDEEQAITQLGAHQIIQESGINSDLLAMKINFNNNKGPVLNPQIQSLQVVQPKYVENTTIEDGIRDKVKQIEQQTSKLSQLKKESQLQSQNQKTISLIQQHESHFQKGLDDVKQPQTLGSSKMIPSAQQRNKHVLLRQGQFATHKLDQTSINSKYQINQNKLILDQNEAMKRLEAIDKSVPSYQDFLQLVKVQQNKDDSETATQVLHSVIQIHPRYGEYIRYSQKSIISPPLNDNFVIQHPVDKVYLKYCPADGDVSEFTLFYPVLFQDYQDLEKFYTTFDKSDTKDVGKNQFLNMIQLQKNTFKLFKYNIDVATFKQSYNPSPEIRKLVTLLPQVNNTIKYIKLSSITCNTKGYVPLIFKLLEDLTLTKISFVQLGVYDYIKLPVQNVTIKSLHWTLKLVRTLIVERLSYSSQIFTVSMQDMPSTFVTSSDDARKVQFQIIPGQLLRREAESPAAFFMFWAQQKYGVKAIVSNLAFNFIVNLAYYQYENEEIYLYTRMFFEDLENDYYLLYLEIRRILGFQGKTDANSEFLATQAIPSVTATILQNWEPKRQYAFVQNVFSILYSKQQNDEFVVPTQISLQQFIQLILFAYGGFRRTAFQQAGLVFNYLAKEQKTGNLIGEGGFRQYCQILIPQWSAKTISEMFFAFSAGLEYDVSTDLSIRRMSIQNLQEMFISLQLGRFSQVSSDILDKTVSTELKKLIKNSVFVFQQLQTVSKQIIRILLRHAALQNGEKYLKFSKILKCYVDVIQCDLMAYDFVNSMSNMRLVLSTIIESMLEILPDACIVTIGGSMTALKQFLGAVGK
ncbi:hypothetical protein SS50377_23339 [Spironucleus salmonicida]|uniref:Uncharacterized protein n=1 Tax=Spironucleus salmonicida TaxID=348837 RepID=V6M1Y8_9EUKA|nr:hypothetical protein SS50377_23339 [Spironucleus salmonicida]|eukprot:EST47209.1 Hypothetical protein SS50377_12719 [Spironucleus salmonicida]